MPKSKKEIKNTTKKPSAKKRFVTIAEKRIKAYNAETKRAIKKMLDMSDLMFFTRYIDVEIRYINFDSNDEYGDCNLVHNKKDRPKFVIRLNKGMLNGTHWGRVALTLIFLHELAHVYSWTAFNEQPKRGPLGDHNTTHGIIYSILWDKLMG